MTSKRNEYINYFKVKLTTIYDAFHFQSEG